MNAHYRYYAREMRIRAYAQLLESYKSVTLASMADAYGVSVDYLDRCVRASPLQERATAESLADGARWLTSACGRGEARLDGRGRDTTLGSELSRYIYGGRLNCVIDKVANVVETNRPDTKNALYQVR